MIYTSYFSSYKGGNGVSIAVGTPTWFNGDSCRELFPPWSLVQQWKSGSITRKEYRRTYIRQLKALDVDDFAKRLNNKVLLCYEKPDNFCHRKIVMEWFTRNGYRCEELRAPSEKEVCIKCKFLSTDLKFKDCFCSITGEIVEDNVASYGCKDWSYRLD